jgi:hypothetical protein
MELKLPEYGQHIVFCGSTGSGKSYLAERMLRCFDHYFAIDTQNSLNLDDARTITTPAQLASHLRWQKKLKYIPALNQRERGTWNSIFAALDASSTKRKPSERIIYIDEIFHLGYGPSFPIWLPRAITTARQKRISYWIATQRPKQIPMPVLSEASKIYAFYLSREDDIHYLAGFARSDKDKFEAALLSQKNDYSFIEIDVRTGSWHQYSKLSTKEN